MSNIIQLPGLIDIHVHFKDPGQTHKEDFYTGSCAAIAGGVTTIFDMPTHPYNITSLDELEMKIENIKSKSVCDWGLYFGTDGKNIDEFIKVQDKIVGMKIYLNPTTNHIVISEDLLNRVLDAWPKNKIIVVHAEDEMVDYIIKLAKIHKNHIHITHVNTQDALEKIIDAKSKKLDITCDVTPHHLFLTDETVKIMGGFAIMKPPLATERDKEFLWSHLSDIDCIATDHAPHTIAEKQSENPPTGVPGLETMLPLLLTAVNENRLSIEELKRLTNINPQKIFGYKQEKNTYIEVDMDEKYKIKSKYLLTKCGWSPFTGWEMHGQLKRVFVRGTKVFDEGKILVKPGFGQNVLM